METLTARVKARALALGFTKVGIAEAAPLEDHALRLHEWLSRGYQGSMQWMGRSEEKRGDPRRVLPGCRSVIVVAMNYYTDIARLGGRRPRSPLQATATPAAMAP